MRFLLFFFIILHFSCENKNESIVNKQQVIKKEMEETKKFYYIKTDSLEREMASDTSTTRQHQIPEEIRALDGKRVSALLKLQLEYDSLETERKK